MDKVDPENPAVKAAVEATRAAIERALDWAGEAGAHRPRLAVVTAPVGYPLAAAERQLFELSPPEGGWARDSGSGFFIVPGAFRGIRPNGYPVVGRYLFQSHRRADELEARYREEGGLFPERPGRDTPIVRTLHPAEYEEWEKVRRLGYDVPRELRSARAPRAGEAPAATWGTYNLLKRQPEIGPASPDPPPRVDLVVGLPPLLERAELRLVAAFGNPEKWPPAVERWGRVALDLVRPALADLAEKCVAAALQSKRDCLLPVDQVAELAAEVASTSSQGF